MSRNSIVNTLQDFFSGLGSSIKEMRNSSREKNRGKPKKHPVKRFFGFLGRCLLTVFLVALISGSIIATTVTVYIVKDLDKDIDFDLNSLKISLTSTLYVKDAEQKYVEYQKLHGSINREWVAYNEIPQCVKDGIVSIEDQRYWSHHGVDWKSTFAAFLGMFLKQDSSSTRGGSTITQQLIKNITKEDKINPERKLKEIFRALELEKQYTKEEILESYLNVVSFGNGCNGIQAAAQTLL